MQKYRSRGAAPLFILPVCAFLVAVLPVPVLAVSVLVGAALWRAAVEDRRSGDRALKATYIRLPTNITTTRARLAVRPAWVFIQRARP